MMKYVDVPEGSERHKAELLERLAKAGLDRYVEGVCTRRDPGGETIVCIFWNDRSRDWVAAKAPEPDVWALAFDLVKDLAAREGGRP